MEDFTRRRRIQADNDDEEMGSKRIRGPEGADIGGKLINMISRVDENIKGTLEKTIEELSVTLEHNLEPYEAQIISILSECAMYLPEKLTMFTTLIGILNSKNSEFGANMVTKLICDMNDAFAKEDYDIALRLCTFICDLGNAHVIDTQSLVEFLEGFVNFVGEENAQSNYFAYLVMHALPWIGPELQESKPVELDTILSRLEIYLGKRRKLHVKMLQVWSANQAHPQEDYLDCLWIQIQKLKKDKWLEHHIVRLYASFKDALGNEAVVRHQIPSISLEVIQSNKKFPPPRIVFRLFDYTDIPDSVDQALPPDTSIERFLVEEDLNWIIDNNYLEWHLCAKVLLNYHRREAVPLNYVIIEVIFAQLFRLPCAPHLELFYGALLIELCRTKPESMPQVLAQAAELLYQRADTMQQVCLDRFVDWFSYHLSNFQYRWSWSDWADCLELDSLHPRRIFVREVIEKCLRLSYYKKVVEFLPDVFQDIIPPEPSIIYVLDDEKHELKEHARDFYALMTEKRPAEEILKLLEKSADEENSEKRASYDPNSVAVFCAVLFKLASRTFSHSFAALTKYHKIFRTVVEDSEEMQSVILRTLYDCWNRHKQMLTVLVDKLLKMQIVDPAIVQAWVFCDDMKREFKRSWVWDVLNTAITRLECHYRKLSDIQRELKMKIDELKKKGSQIEDDPMEGTGGENEGHRPKIIAPESELKEEMDVDSIAPSTDFDGLKGKNKSSLEAMERKLLDSTASLLEVEENLRAVLLNICHKFTLILTEHLMNCENDETEIETDFYNYVLGRFRHIFLAHADSMFKFADDLDRELFNTPTIEKRIREVFLEFQALKS